MNFFQIFMVLGLFSNAGLVMANPIRPLTYASPIGLTIASNSLPTVGAEATTLPDQLAEEGIYQEAKCLYQNDCCILDFNCVPCADHKKPVCDEKSCRPVPSAIDFRYAAPSSFDVDSIRQPINFVNHDCVNVPDKHGKDKVYNQFFISHCTKNIDGVELYTEPDCRGLSSIQKNTAGCYHAKFGQKIHSFKIWALPGLISKREYLLGGSLLNESDPYSTSAYLSQGNKASVTPADDCFDEQTGAYILGCKIGRSETSADALVEPKANDVADDVNPEIYLCTPVTGEYQHCALKNAALVDGPETFKVCWPSTSMAGGQPSNIPYNLDLPKFQLAYAESYGELTIINAADCGGEIQTVLNRAYCTTVLHRWGRILSYRVWLEGTCAADSIGPCPRINGGSQGIKDHQRAPKPSKSTSRLLHLDKRTRTGPVTTETHIIPETVRGIAMKFTETRKSPVHVPSTSTGVVARSKFTTSKVTAQAASVGVTATVSF